jgi:hypothetical protein
VRRTGRTKSPSRALQSYCQMPIHIDGEQVLDALVLEREVSVADVEAPCDSACQSEGVPRRQQHLHRPRQPPTSRARRLFLHAVLTTQHKLDETLQDLSLDEVFRGEGKEGLRKYAGPTVVRKSGALPSAYSVLLPVDSHLTFTTPRTRCLGYALRLSRGSE